MAALVEDHQLGVVADPLLVGERGRDRDHAVVPAPDDQGRHADLLQAMADVVATRVGQCVVVAGALEGGHRCSPRAAPARSEFGSWKTPRKAFWRSRGRRIPAMETERQRRRRPPDPPEYRRRLATGPRPGDARGETRTSSSTRSGSVIATSVAMNPPIELPISEQRSSPTARRSHARTGRRPGS